MKTIHKELFKSTALIKLVLFLFLGMSYFQSNAQCPPTSTYSSVNASDIFTSDGQITVTVDAPAVGPFDFYLTDLTGSIIQQDFGQVLNIYTFQKYLAIHNFISWKVDTSGNIKIIKITKILIIHFRNVIYQITK